MHGDLFLGSDHSTAFLSECSSRCSGFFFLFLSFQLALGRDLPPQLLANAIVPPVPFWVPHPIEGKKDLGGLPRGRGAEVAGQTSQWRMRVLNRRRDCPRGFPNSNIAVRAEGELKD